MKIKKGFDLKNVCNEYVIVAYGKENIDFTKIISLNESAAYLWNKVKDTEFEAEQLAQLLLDEYEVDAETALNDARDIMKSWKEAGLRNKFPNRNKEKNKRKKLFRDLHGKSETAFSVFICSAPAGISPAVR